MNPRIDELRQQLRQLDELVRSGALSEDQARESRARLERELLDLVVAAPPAANAPTRADTPTAATAGEAPARPSRGLVAAIAGFVVVVAAAGYAWFGTPGALSGRPPATDTAQGDPSAQIGAMVGRLEDRLKSEPNDAEGWSMLGRSYNVLGRYAEAVEAFKKVVALRPGDAQALADQADATAMAAGRKLAGEPEQLIQRALALDPKNLKALALSGTIAFDRGDYAGAAQRWEDALGAAEPGSELARNLQGGIAEARSRAGLPALAASAPGASVAAVSDAQVSGRVELAAALKAQAAPEDTLFVYARAVQGPRAPLAILRKQVKDLPLDFRLDDSLAMNPALRLSTATQVVVGARISKSGNAIAQPGDLQGLSAPVAVGTRDLKIEIGEVVK